MLGKTFGNLMVDLRITNKKLSARANRIVRRLTGLDETAAADLLERCGGDVKTALVAHLANLSPEDAHQRLGAAGGQVREVLEKARPIQAPIPSGPDDLLILGIDGGATHTTALLARMVSLHPGWNIIGTGEGGPSNIQAVGSGKAVAALDQAIGRAFETAGLKRKPVAAAYLGLAGAGRADDQALIRTWASGVSLATRVEVTSDTSLLLAAGTPEGWGIAVVAGTGSMAFARNREGRTARAGGWGHLLGDEGSGFAIAVAGLRAVARAADGRGPTTSLTEHILTKLKLHEPQMLVQAIYRGGMDVAAVAALAPLLLTAAEQGDAVAIEIAQKAAGQLAMTTAAAARKLELGAGPVPLALAGGVMHASQSYRDRFLQSLEALGLQAAPVMLVRQPAEGALRLAANAHVRG